MLQNTQNVHPARQLAEPPAIKILPGCGFEGDQTVAVQVMVNYWEGKVTGAHLNVMNGKAHRLAVTRLCSMDEYFDPRMGEEFDTILRARVGKKTVDRNLRPTTRLDLLFYRQGPHGLGKINMQPWMQAFGDITTGLQWCIDAANTEKTQAFGLIALLDISKPVLKTSARYGCWDEAEIVGIRDISVQRLESAPPATPITNEVKATQQHTAKHVKANAFSDDD